MSTLSSTTDKDKQELTIDQIILSAMEVGVMIEHCLIDSTREEQLPKYRKALTDHSRHLIDKIVSELPEKKTDTEGHHEDHTPEQLTRITAMNRFYNQAIQDVLDILNKVKGSL